MLRARDLASALRMVAAWLLVVCVLVAPTSLGRGTLLMLVEGPCPPDCAHVDDDEEADEGHAPISHSSEHRAEDTMADGHTCAWQAERDNCPPDCDDCTCCGNPTVAVVQFSALSFGVLEACTIDCRGPSSPAQTASRTGLYRPPKRLLATTTIHTA